MVSILAVLFLAVMASLAVAFATTTDMTLTKSRNHRAVLEAELVAESGLNYMIYVVTSAELPSGSAGQEALDELATVLSDELDGTANLQGQGVSYDGATIAIPPIALDDQRSFATEIALESDNIAISVTGSVAAGAESAISRIVGMQFAPGSGGSTYGIFSQGPISIGQNLNLVGANKPSEGSIYSAAQGQAVTITSGYVDGDVCAYYGDAGIAVGAEVNGQIRRGVPEVLMPEIDGSVFEPFATNIIDEQDDISGTIFENIRIVAGTNPEFGSNVVILGVMYVEAPNIVTFQNNVDFTGVIVTEDPGEGADPEDHWISFKNNLTIHGLEELPDQLAYAELRELGGTAIIAPGFTVEFKNNFSSVSGTIAVEGLIFKNNLEATVYGTIVILGTEGISFKNNTNLTIDTSKYGGLTPGMTTPGPVTLTPRADSYTEG